MERISIDIPENLKFLRNVSNVDWTILAGKMIQSKISQIQDINEILSESELTEKDVGELSDKINKDLSSKY